MRTKWLVILLSAVIACNSSDRNASKEVVAEKLQTGLVKFIGERMSGTKACVVIPREGCTGCIGHAAEYLIANIDNIDSAYVILTDIKDKRLLQLQMGKEFMCHRKVLLDTSNQLISVFDSPYPKMFFFEGTHIFKTVDFDENQPEFKQLVKTPATL